MVTNIWWILGSNKPTSLVIFVYPQVSYQTIMTMDTPTGKITTSNEGNSTMGERCSIAMLVYWWYPLVTQKTKKYPKQDSPFCHFSLVVTNIWWTWGSNKPTSLVIFVYPQVSYQITMTMDTPTGKITTSNEGNSTMGERCSIAMLVYWWYPLVTQKNKN